MPLDLDAMKTEHNGLFSSRKQVKTFLTTEAHDRINAAADYVGCPAYLIVERLVLEHLPDPETLKG